MSRVPYFPLSSTETSNAVLKESKQIRGAKRAVKDRANESPHSHSSPSLEVETFPGDEGDHHTVSRPAKELSLLEEPAPNVKGESPTDQTRQGALETNYQNLLRHNEELEKDYAELWEEWKELGEVLSNLRARHQPLGQLEDKDLIQCATELRYNISNLSQQWPEGGSMKNAPTEVPYLPYLQAITPDSSSYYTLLIDPDRRPQIIEAFIWRVLAGELFGRFCWAGEEIASSVRDLTKWLAAISESDPSRNSDLRMWTSKTTELLLETLDVKDQETSDRLGLLKRRIVEQIIRALGVPENSEQGIVLQLDDILDKALDLDRDFSQQVAKWEWKHPEFDCEGRLAFDQATMMSDERSKKKRPRVVQLIVSPALVKRGDANGENYGLETIVMKMGVSFQRFQR